MAQDFLGYNITSAITKGAHGFGFRVEGLGLIQVKDFGIQARAWL